MSLFDELGGKELSESPYQNLVYESPSSSIKCRGSRILSYLKQALTPISNQLKKLEEEDEFPVEEPAKDCDSDDVPVFQDTNQELGISINGEVVWI